jgi:hypothetical protein
MNKTAGVIVIISMNSSMAWSTRDRLEYLRNRGERESSRFRRHDRVANLFIYHSYSSIFSRCHILSVTGKKESDGGITVATIERKIK